MLNIFSELKQRLATRKSNSDLCFIWKLLPFSVLHVTKSSPHAQFYKLETVALFPTAVCLTQKLSPEHWETRQIMGVRPAGPCSQINGYYLCMFAFFF